MNINIRTPHLFTERRYQSRLLHAFQRRRHLNHFRGFLQRWHRRAGKDLTDFAAIIVPEMGQKIGNYYHVFPTYNQGRKIMWNGIDREGVPFLDRIPPEMVLAKNKSEMRVECVNGSAYQIIGADKIDNVVGTNPAGIVFSEFSLTRPDAFDLFKPILRENKGWAVANFTPRGKNHAYDLEQMALSNPEEWHVDVLNVKQTGVLTPEEMERERQDCIAKNGDDAFFQSEWMVSYTASVVGAYYQEQFRNAEMEGRLSKRGMWDPHLPVFDVWDLGIGDALAIGFWQVSGNEWWMIDYEELIGKSIPVAINLCQRKPYTYGRHFAPHDIRHRSQSTGKTRLQTAKDLGWPFEVVPSISVQDGIDLARAFWRLVWIDQETCPKFLRLIPQYSKRYDEVKRCFAEEPNHDWTSHGADMFRYSAIVKDMMVAGASRPDRTRLRQEAMAKRKTYSHFRKKY